jgi:predicted DsbA family dithiol-disulfide isomerase
VRTAHRLALASKQIRADMVEISEFPHLAVRYSVRGVPLTVINEGHPLVGARSEVEVMAAVLQALATPPHD